MTGEKYCPWILRVSRVCPGCDGRRWLGPPHAPITCDVCCAAGRLTGPLEHAYAVLHVADAFLLVGASLMADDELGTSWRRAQAWGEIKRAGQPTTEQLKARR